MKILASILMIFGLLVALGGVAGIFVGSPSGIVRLIIGVVIIGVAFAMRPKSKKENESRVSRRNIKN